MFNKILILVFGLVIATSAWYTNVVKAQDMVTDGLISIWTFDRSDIAGKAVKDVSGNNDGAIEGNPKTVNGKIEEALEFDGKDDYIDCGNDKSISDFSTAYSIEAWAYFVVADNYPGLFQRGDKTASSQIEIYLQPNANLTTVHNRDSIYYVYWSPVPLNQWTHIAVVWEKKGWKVYYDGAEQPQTGEGGTAANPDTGETCYIGLGYTENPMNGIIDEVKIYNRALSANEIQKNLKATSNTLAVEPVNKLAITWSAIKGATYFSMLQNNEGVRY